MKKFIACLFLASAATCFGQKNFMKGYYSDIFSLKNFERLIKVST